jgi:small-conductance mechanosensitive channel/CRP-like cAMP-binding protein
MTTPNSEDQESVFKKLLVPFVLSLLLGVVILYGGEAYQATGLAVLENTVTILGHVLGIAEFFVLAILVRRIVQYIILDRLVAAALGTPTPRLLSQLSAFIIYTLAIAAIVGVVFKKDLTVILTAFGGAGIVIGLALQGVIFDLFAGLIINLDRSIKMGDCIRLAGDSSIQGEVEEISWRTVRILDTECNTIFVPNSKLFSSIITNYSLPKSFIEIEVSIILDIEVPVERALRILLSAATEVAPGVCIPEAPNPNAKVRAITLEGVEYGVQIYPSFKTRAKARNLLQQQMIRHLGFAGLTPARSKQERIKANPDLSKYLRSDATHIASLLKTTALFQDLAQPELQLLASVASMRSLPANALVVQGGEIACSMFLLIEGLLIADEWRKKVGKKSQEAEKILGPGYLMSACEMIAGGSYAFTVRAKSSVLLCEIDYSAIEKLLMQKPETAQWLSQRVAEQMLSINPKNKTVAELTSEVFTNMRRSYAHLQLSQCSM